MNKYPHPRVGEIRRCKAQGICVLCQKSSADRRVGVEINAMRGDDLVYKAHQDCIKRFHDVLLQKLMGG